MIELAKELNYAPNKFALSLKNHNSKTIGVIIPEVVHYFFASVISGIEEVAYTNGYTLMFCQSYESYEKEILDTMALLSHRIVHLAGSLNLQICQRRKDGFVAALAENNMPLT